MIKEIVQIEEFLKLDIRVGTIINAEVFKEAIKPAYLLKIDFGEKLGIKKSSAQITQLYEPENLIGEQVLAVVNFEPRQIGPIMSEVLVLGIYAPDGVVLIGPKQKTENGNPLG